jgi:hypothetical protein
MMDVLMREVQCANCGTLTRHRASILERIIQHQSELREDVRYINYACPECNMLTRSQILPGAKVFRDVDPLRFPADLTVEILSLECDATGCESPVILLAATKHEEGKQVFATAKMHLWRTRSAQCASHHPPRLPLDFRGSYSPPN